MPAARRKKYDSVELKPLASSMDDIDDDDDKLSPTDQWLKYALHKLHAILWIVIAGAVAWWTKLYEICTEGHPPTRPEVEINRFFFNVGLAGFGGWLLLAAYLIVYLKYIKQIPGEWEEYWPQAIPIATGCAVTSLLAFVIAFWPVWTWFTIPAIFVLFLGVLNLAHFVPL